MPVQLWIGQEFETTHERRALHNFLNDMQARFGQSDELYLVLANYFIGSRQVDLTVLKRDAVIVIELKEFADPFRATENGDWRTPGGRVVGTAGQNPFEQARDYRFAWTDFLRDNQDRFLPSGKARSMDFQHVSAFVAISPFLHPESQNEIPGSPWFRLVGLDHLVDVVYQQTSRKLNFASQELISLVTQVLNLRQVADASCVKEPVDHWAQYCQILLANHRDWAGMPPRLYISPERMDIGPAWVIPYRTWPDDLPDLYHDVRDQNIQFPMGAG